MRQSFNDLLDSLFGHWRSVAEETVHALGEDDAGFFVDAYNDALDINGAILNSYPKEELESSILLLEFTGVLKEIHWLLVLFLAGNYPFALSRLRHIWERIFRAYYAEHFTALRPHDSDSPGPTIDDKHNWLMRREKSLTWSQMIVPVLNRLFTAEKPKDVEQHFKELWQQLNRCVHPSAGLRNRLTAESALHARDAFDEAWARETLDAAREVFALLWLATASSFPSTLPVLRSSAVAFAAIPQLKKMPLTGL